MPNFLIAIIVVVGGLWLIRKAAKMSPQAASGFAYKAGGVAVIGFSAMLALRGQMQLAVPVFLFGAGLIGKNAAFPNGFKWPGAKSTGQKSRVATSVLSMELDHDTGTMDGDVLQGPSRGKRLSQLNDGELRSLHQLSQSATDQSQALLEAWLDRNRDDWRNAWQAGGKAADTRSGAMSRDEARAILGVKPDATQDEVRAAHRRLMKDFHPDKGGSDYLAAKINAAKDVLLNGA